MQDAKIFRAMATDPREENTKAQEMHMSARLFVKDAADLGDRNSAGQYVLSIHAIELALKAYLHRKGMPLDDLQKRYGHNLRKLLDEACRHGLPPMDAQADRVITDLNTAAKKARIRYEFSFGLPVALNIVTVANAVLERTYTPPPPL